MSRLPRKRCQVTCPSCGRVDTITEDARRLRRIRDSLCRACGNALRVQRSLLKKQQQMHIAYYNIQSGGKWLTWKEDRLLRSSDLTQRHPVRVEVSGRWVHALLLRDHEGKLMRWDCVNGFTGFHKFGEPTSETNA